jgi:hypothetical protein
MDTEIIAWLNGVSTAIFRLAAMLFAILNLAAVGVVVGTRSRAVVNRWTSPWLAANFVLLGAGLGVSLLASLAKVAVRAIAAAGGVFVPITD